MARTTHDTKRKCPLRHVAKVAGIGLGAYALGCAFAFEFTVDTKSPVSIFAMKSSGKDKAKMATASTYDLEATDWFKEKKEAVYTPGLQGRKLHAWTFKPEGTPRPHQYAVCVHGYMGEPSETSPWAYHYAHMGFTVYVPSLRGDALDDGRFTGMGYTEKFDVNTWVKYIVARDPEAQILLSGISMGGSTCLLCAGETDIPSNVKAIVSDSAFDDSYEVMVGSTMRNTHMPRPIAKLFVDGVDVINRFVQGFSFHDINVADAVKKIDLPVLFIQGSEDEVVPAHSMEILYQADNAAGAEKLMVVGSQHAFEVIEQPDLYWNKVNTFVDRYFPAPDGPKASKATGADAPAK
ncbi:MAG: alpha/beta fold hydrolase [Bifidobacterium sp.]|nr:alpha/beta fold hydrolase [Bifidobacterium sp.]